MPIKIAKKEIQQNKTDCDGNLYLSNGSIIHFRLDKEKGWFQSGGSKEELWITKPYVEKIWNLYISNQL